MIMIIIIAAIIIMIIMMITINYMFTACAASMIDGSNADDVTLTASSRTENAFKALRDVSGMWVAGNSDGNPYLIAEIHSLSPVTIRNIQLSVGTATSVESTTEVRLYISDSIIFDGAMVAVSFMIFYTHICIWNFATFVTFSAILWLIS